jgi:hypothetical protein
MFPSTNAGGIATAAFTGAPYQEFARAITERRQKKKRPGGQYRPDALPAALLTDDQVTY